MKVAPSGILTILAGNGIKGDSGDGGLAILASLGSSLRVAVSGRGNIYVADQDAFRVRKITPDGTITAVAGTGAPGFSGDGGPATQATLNFLRTSPSTAVRISTSQIVSTIASAAWTQPVRSQPWQAWGFPDSPVTEDPRSRPC